VDNVNCFEDIFESTPPPSSSSSYNDYIMSSLESYRIMFSTYDGNQNLHTKELTEYTGLFFFKVAYSRFEVLSEML
jgi:hypothetical protein